MCRHCSGYIGGYMLAKTLVVFYVWSLDIFVLSFYQNLFSGIAYSIMSNKTLPCHYHTIVSHVYTSKVLITLSFTVTLICFCLVRLPYGDIVILYGFHVSNHVFVNFRFYIIFVLLIL